jgi:hypothetical protein
MPEVPYADLASFVWPVLAAVVLVIATVGVIAAFAYRGDR